MATGRRGRRPSGAGTKEAIAEAARRQFGEHGYRRASIRGIAAEAGVDPRLVMHFFGSKHGLFVAVIELPFEPEATFDALLGPGEKGLGQRLAAFYLGALADPESRKIFTGMIRAATSEEEAATTIREFVVGRLLLPLAARLGRDRPEFRASLLASQVVGLVMARHVVGLPALAAAPDDELIAAMAPVFDRYLTGDLS